MEFNRLIRHLSDASLESGSFFLSDYHFSRFIFVVSSIWPLDRAVSLLIISFLAASIRMTPDILFFVLLFFHFLFMIPILLQLAILPLDNIQTLFSSKILYRSKLKNQDTHAF